MPLATESLVDPGEVQHRAPLKKSTVGWLLCGVVALALLGVFAPRLFRNSLPEEAPKPEKAVGVGQPRLIEGEFEEADRKSRAESERQRQVAAAAASLPVGTITAAPIVPIDARREANSAALYNNKLEGTDAKIELDAQARNSTSLKYDFNDSSQSLISSSLNPTTEASATRPRALPESSVPASASTAPSDRLAEVLDLQRRAATPTSARGADVGWLKEFGDASRPAPLKPYLVQSPFTLLQGKTLPAVLGKDLNTDLPGEVTAYVTEDVYDSLSSRHLLVPKGSLLSGKYSNAIKVGQERILFAFTRVTLPNGVSVDLPGFSGADHGGAAGVGGDVDNHFFKQFASSFLVALLADRAEKGKSAPAIATGGATGGAVSAAGQVLVDVSKSILDRNKSIDPTITVSKGTRILVEVTKDIEFAAAYRSRS